MSKMKAVRLCLAGTVFSLALLLLPLRAQEQPQPAAPAPAAQAQPGEAQEVKLRIGKGDELEINVYGVPELSQKTRVSGEGNISIPLLGRVRVEGLTNEEAEAAIARRLVEGMYLKNPQVTVFVKQYTTEAVSVVGEVVKPGTYPLPGSGSLLEVILAAGGLTPKAGYTVLVTHRDSPGAPITVKLAGDQPQEPVQLLPGDIVNVPKGDIVYVLGAVNQPGGYVMPDKPLTVLDAVARAAGPAQAAALGKTKLVRKYSDGVKEVRIELSSIMQGRKPDIPLQAEDIVYIPPKKGGDTLRTILSVVGMAAIIR